MREGIRNVMKSLIIIKVSLGKVLSTSSYNELFTFVCSVLTSAAPPPGHRL